MATTASRPAALAGAVETVYVDRFCDGIIGPERRGAGHRPRRRHDRREHGARLLGADDHARDPGRPRGDAAGERRGRRGRRRDRDPHPLDRRDVVATSSGNDRTIEGRFNGDPYCAKVCASCGAEDEATVVEGIGAGRRALRRVRRAGGAVRVHQRLHDRLRRRPPARRDRRPASRREAFAHDAAHAAALPPNSVQNPILLFAPSDLVGVVARMRPFMGQLGTMPAIDLPDSHNAGDFGAFLVGAPHRHARDRRAARRAHRRPPRHRRRPRGGDPRLPGEGARRRRLPRRHARDAGRRRDRRPHRRRRRHRHAAGLGHQGPGHRRAGAVPGRRGPAVPRAAADRRRSARGAEALAQRYGGGASRTACRSRSSAPARTSTARSRTASAAPRRCSAWRSPRS